MKSAAFINTREGTAYIRKLCRHFAVKVKATYTETSGEVWFPYSYCTMRTTPEQFIVTVAPENADDIDKAESVIVRHLEKFAWREKLEINWQRYEDE